MKAAQYKTIFINLSLTFVLATSSLAQARTEEPVFFDALTPSDQPAETGSLSFCMEQQWTATCLQLLMIYRCNQYAFPLPGGARECSFTVPAAVKLLDVFQHDVEINIPGQPKQVKKTKLIFKDRLEQLIRDPSSQKYLADLAQALEDAVDYQEGFDLYAFTLKQAGGDRFRALEWLAVFLQDTTWTMLPVLYFEAQNNVKVLDENVMTAVRNLRRSLYVLKPTELVKENYRNWIKLYPSDQIGDLTATLNSTIYHYYPMAYWSALMTKAKASKRMSFFLPFLFNADYEFKSMSEARWPLQHPLPFKLDSLGQHQARDVYAGFAGAIYGSGIKNVLVPESEFAKRLSSGPFQEMQRLYWGTLF